MGRGVPLCPLLIDFFKFLSENAQFCAFFIAKKIYVARSRDLIDRMGTEDVKCTGG